MLTLLLSTGASRINKNMEFKEKFNTNAKKKKKKLNMIVNF